jgi:hypothetical protein
MSVPNFWSRFRKQFTNEEWDKLNKNSLFRKALENKDEVKAGILADQILIGDAKTKSQARQMKKDCDSWADFKTLFSDEEWVKLNNNSQFKKALDEKIISNALFLADQILIGDAKTKTQTNQVVE